MRTILTAQREASLDESVGRAPPSQANDRATIAELVNVSKWDAPERLTARLRRNEALQSLIELSIALWRARSLARGVWRSEPLGRLLDDVTLKIPAGCVVGVIDIGGRSRTALLQMLGNVRSPSRGEVRLYGRMGSTAQALLLPLPHLTCRINLINSARVVGMQAAAIDEALGRVDAFSGLGGFLDVSQRRVPKPVLVDLAMSWSCCLDLDLLVADEVSRPVSERVRESWHEYLQSAPERKMTVVISGKRVEPIIAASTHLLLIDQGRVRAFGPTEEVSSDHARFLEDAASAPTAADQTSDFDETVVDGDDDYLDDGEPDDESVAIPAVEEPDLPPVSKPSYPQADLQPAREARIRLSFDLELFRQAQRTSEEPEAPLPHVSGLCRIRRPVKPLFRHSVGSNFVLPVQTLVPNLRLRPELEISTPENNVRVLRIRTNHDIVVEEPSLVMLEAPVPPRLLARGQYELRAALEVAQDEGPPSLLGSKEIIKFRVKGRGKRSADEASFNLHGQATWQFKRGANRTSENDLWLSLPANGGGEIMLTSDGIPVVGDAEDLEFSTSINIERAGSEVSAFLVLQTAAGGTIRYALPTPERDARPGPYSLSVTISGRELGCSPFHVTLTTLIGSTQSSGEVKPVQRDGSFVITRDAATTKLATAPAAMELEPTWNVR